MELHAHIGDRGSPQRLSERQSASVKQEDEAASSEFVERDEHGRNQRTWAKAITGFELLPSACFIITDRLHGLIGSTFIGALHVLTDSTLCRRVAIHDT